MVYLFRDSQEKASTQMVFMFIGAWLVIPACALWPDEMDNRKRRPRIFRHGRKNEI